MRVRTEECECSTGHQRVDMTPDRAGFLVIPASNYGVRLENITLLPSYFISVLQGEHRTYFYREKVVYL